MTHDQIGQRVRASFARQSMMQTLGASLDTIAPGKVTITAPIATHCMQQHGYGHAGLTFAIGDSAAGYAALTLMPEGAEVLTAEMKINLLAPAVGENLRAIGQVIKPGKRLIVVTAEVQAISGGSVTAVALLQGTMVPVMPLS